MSDPRPRARTPGLTDMGLEVIGGDIAHELVSVPPLDQRDALSRQGFKFDRADFRAVPVRAATVFGLFVVVKIAIDTGCDETGS